MRADPSGTITEAPTVVLPRRIPCTGRDAAEPFEDVTDDGLYEARAGEVHALVVPGTDTELGEVHRVVRVVARGERVALLTVLRAADGSNDHPYALFGGTIDRPRPIMVDGDPIGEAQFRVRLDDELLLAGAPRRGARRRRDAAAEPAGALAAHHGDEGGRPERARVREPPSPARGADRRWLAHVLRGEDARRLERARQRPRGGRPRRDHDRPRRRRLTPDGVAAKRTRADARVRRRRTAGGRHRRRATRLQCRPRRARRPRRRSRRRLGRRAGPRTPDSPAPRATASPPPRGASAARPG